MQNRYTILRVTKEARDLVRRAAAHQRRHLGAAVQVMAEEYLERHGLASRSDSRLHPEAAERRPAPAAVPA